MTNITFLVYLCYLVFQLFSHKNLYQDDASVVQQSVAYPANVAKRLHIRGPPASSSPPPVMDPALGDGHSLEAGSEGEEEKPEMCLQTTITLLIIVTVVCR